MLFFLRDNNIHSAEDFQNYVSSAYRNFENIKSEKNKLLEKIAEEEKIVKDIPNYLELKNKVPLLAKDIKELAKYNYLKSVGTDIEEHKQNLEMLKCQLFEIDEKLENAKSEKKQAEDNFNSYMLNMKTDYEILLEQARAEMEELLKKEEKQEYEIDEKQKLPYEPKKEFQKNER